VNVSPGISIQLPSSLSNTFKCYPHVSFYEPVGSDRDENTIAAAEE
jgi:hypothetical protein